MQCSIARPYGTLYTGRTVGLKRTSESQWRANCVVPANQSSDSPLLSLYLQAPTALNALQLKPDDPWLDLTAPPPLQGLSACNSSHFFAEPATDSVPSERVRCDAYESTSTNIGCTRISDNHVSSGALIW